MSVRSTVAADNANAQENLFAFDAGDATKFMNGFKAAIKTCSQQQGVAVRLDPVAGRGDEAFRIAPPEPGGTLPFDLIAIRLGDRVVALLSTYSPAHPVLTDSVVAEAVSKAEAG